MNSPVSGIDVAFEVYIAVARVQTSLAHTALLRLLSLAVTLPLYCTLGWPLGFAIKRALLIHGGSLLVSMAIGVQQRAMLLPRVPPSAGAGAEAERRAGSGTIARDLSPAPALAPAGVSATHAKAGGSAVALRKHRGVRVPEVGCVGCGHQAAVTAVT